MDVQLYIRPKGRNGLLLWSGQDVMTTNSDFVALGFVDGSLQLHYNLGSGKALVAYNDSRLFDGQWHFIRVQRYWKFVPQNYQSVKNTEDFHCFSEKSR